MRHGGVVFGKDVIAPATLQFKRTGKNIEAHLNRETSCYAESPQRNGVSRKLYGSGEASTNSGEAVALIKLSPTNTHGAQGSCASVEAASGRQLECIGWSLHVTAQQRNYYVLTV